MVLKDANNFTLLQFTTFDIIYLDSHFFHQTYHHSDHIFVDAVKYHRSHTHPIYIWESTGRTVSSSFLSLRNVNSTYSDMCAVTSSWHSGTIQAEGCSDSHYALCQLRKQ